MRIIHIAAVAALLIPAAASAQKVGTTRQQVIDRAAQRFKKLDTDGNGQITSAELAAQAQAAGKPAKPRGVNRLMKADADGDGAVSLQEFQNAAGARFDWLDTNKNGTIDEGEQADRRGGDGG